MNKFWDYKTVNSNEYKLGFTVLSGWQRVYAALGVNGNIHTSIYWYYDSETGEYSKEVVTINYPITTFCGWLNAVKVGLIKVDKRVAPNEKVKLPPLRDVVLMDNLKRSLEK